MTDEDLRGAERASLSDPEDFEAFQRWRAAAARAGATPPGAERPVAQLVAEMEYLERRWYSSMWKGSHLCGARGDRAKRIRFRALDDHAQCFRRFIRLFRVWLRVMGRRAEWDAHFFGPADRFPKERRVLETSLLFSPSSRAMMLMQNYVPLAMGRRRRRIERMATLKSAGLVLRQADPPLVETSGST